MPGNLEGLALNLDAARHIYAAAGFKLAGEERHRSFGHDLVAETWELTL